MSRKKNTDEELIFDDEDDDDFDNELELEDFGASRKVRAREDGRAITDGNGRPLIRL